MDINDEFQRWAKDRFDEGRESLYIDGWLDVETRGEHRGTCMAETQPFSDGECYTCPFYIDDDCPYLVDTRVDNPKLMKLVKEGRRI